MLKNIVFDLGNVLVQFDPDAILAHFVAEEQWRPVLKREVFHSIEWVMLDRGTITHEGAIERLEARLPKVMKPFVRPLILNWQEMMPQYPDSLELVRELKAAAVPLYLLSNISLTFRHFAEEIEAVHLMDNLFISSEHQLAKPDPAIFLEAASQFSIKPAESLFIDDVPANAEGAMRAGFTALVFYGDVGRLRRELRDLGFPLTLQSKSN